MTFPTESGWAVMGGELPSGSPLVVLLAQFGDSQITEIKVTVTFLQGLCGDAQSERISGVNIRRQLA